MVFLIIAQIVIFLNLLLFSDSLCMCFSNNIYKILKKFVISVMGNEN